MGWLLALAVIGLLIWLAVRALTPSNTASSHSMDGETHTLQISTSVSLRSYDPDAYRMDGLARPEFHITYADEDGIVTDRDIYVHDWQERGGITYYDCWCFLRDQRRTFRSDRILETVNLDTNRKIKDIAAYRMR